MATQAKVTSVDILESFRASLIAFLIQARRSLDETTDAVRRTRQWLEHEQRTYWEGQIRTRQRALDQAQAELFSARLSKFQDSVLRQQQAVRKAKAAIEEAHEKLRNIKKWHRNYDGLVDPLAKRLQTLRDFLDHDLPKAVAFLSQAQTTLEGYAEIPLSSLTTAPPVATPSETQP